MNDTATAMPLGLTERAIKRIHQILAQEQPGAMFRVAVNGGGCSGFQYAFEIDQSSSQEDYLIQEGGITVLVDKTSLAYLQGSRLDFVDDLIGQSFKIENPNATASCGCGTSFAL